jgi:hypothetical protein
MIYQQRNSEKNSKELQQKVLNAKNNLHIFYLFLLAGLGRKQI